MRHLLIVIAILYSVQANTQLKQPVLVTDMLKIKTVSGVTLTEDADIAAFVITSIEPESYGRWKDQALLKTNK